MASPSQEIDAVCDCIEKIILFKLKDEHASAIKAITDDLKEKLTSRFSNHWFPETPDRGSAFRCIQSTPQRIDPLLHSSLKKHLNPTMLKTVLLNLPGQGDFTIFIDPNDVSLRVGESRLSTQLYGTPRSTIQKSTRSRPASPETKKRSLSPSAESFAPRNSPPTTTKKLDESQQPMIPFQNVHNLHMANFWAWNIPNIPLSRSTALLPQGITAAQ